jgi:hypothetical protein
MNVQQASSLQQFHTAADPALPAFESNFAECTSRAVAVYSDQVPLLAASLAALRDANKFMLPMTVYRTADTYGWAYTNPLALVLRKAEVFVTILPGRYFL